MAGLTPARPKPGRFAPSPKIFGEGATDNAPAGRDEGGGEAGLARVTYFDAITLVWRCSWVYSRLGAKLRGLRPRHAF